jgi:hypothetical protein
MTTFVPFYFYLRSCRVPHLSDTVSNWCTKKIGITKNFSLATKLLKHFHLIRTGVVFLELSKFSKHLFHGRL